ncbi:MAG: YeiH family putative sulfate export transporter [Bryobacterales bacterium]|nr:YeiH family putative sulfate export transporter [Bryobacterales bacterium]
MASHTQRSADEYAWADYLIYMEAGAEMQWPAAAPRKHAVWEGVALTASMALVAYGVVGTGVLPKGTVDPVSVALPLGLLIGNVWKIPERLRAGVRFTVKTVLTVGIVLLGARLDFGDVVRVGAPALLMSATQVAVLFALAFVVRRMFGISGKQAALLGIGTAICGGSAVIATGPVIDAEERDVAFAVATVSFLGLITMFVLPPLGKALGLTPNAFGVWAGLAIHQTPQVVAAGFTFGPEAGQAATLVKLARVSLLAPLVLMLGLMHHKRRKLGVSDFLPPMVLGFLMLALAHSLGWIPSIDVKFPDRPVLGLDIPALAKEISAVAIAMGMAAVGLETSIRSLKKIGPRPILAGVMLTLVGVLFSFIAVRVLGV